MSGDRQSRDALGERLQARVAVAGRCVIAFSGGVDSTYLAAVAVKAIGESALAVTVDTPYIQRREMEEASFLARRLGVKHRVLALKLPAEIADNPTDRCYLCKRTLFGAILALAAELGPDGAVPVFDGTNADDRVEDRPGLRALRELGVASPLRELGFTKATIRELSKDLCLPTWDKPPWTCLLTRLPHAVPVTEAGLRRVEAAEEAIRGLGFKLVRVRDHGSLARIELGPDERARFIDPALMDRVAADLRSLGYRRVALDLEGYRGGGMAG